MTPMPGTDNLVAVLAVSVDGRWAPGLGDPTLGGWLTVAGYVMASAAATVVAMFRGPGLPRRVWIGLAVAMALLAVNKQLDLQSFLTQVGRDLARQQGWHEQRRVVQKQFVYGTIGVGVISFATLLIVLRHHLRELGLALLGFGFVLVFVMVRASSFHHVDHLIGSRVFGLKVNWILEGTGIVLVIGGAGVRIRQFRRC